MNRQDSQLKELLAAEYVLGTLKGQARRRFRSLLYAYPSLRRRVQAWEDRFTTAMTPSAAMETAPAVTPPPAVWAAIEKRLFSDVSA